MSITVYELAGADGRVRFSPHCWKTVWSLAHKGLDFERVPVPFTGIAELGFKTLPVIRDGDRTVVDSFDIAAYLDDRYADRPSLFGGEGGHGAARFIERWTILTVHSILGRALLPDINSCLAPQDQAYFRRTREARFGGTIEAVSEAGLKLLPGLHDALAPLRITLETQPFIGGGRPLFCDYIVAGAFQWARVVSAREILPVGDPVEVWFARMLDLYEGLGRKAATAAAA